MLRYHSPHVAGVLVVVLSLSCAKEAPLGGDLARYSEVGKDAERSLQCHAANLSADVDNTTGCVGRSDDTLVYYYHDVSRRVIMAGREWRAGSAEAIAQFDSLLQAGIAQYGDPTLVVIEVNLVG